MLDPTCADLTARILELLGYVGSDRSNTSATSSARSLHLRRTQEDDGSWYGRWGVNYIYGTWQVLRGLRAIGQNMAEPWMLPGAATGWRAARTKTAAGAKAARLTTIRCSKAAARARRRKLPGR